MSREKTRLFCPGTSDLNWTGKGLSTFFICIFLITKDCKGEIVSHAAYVQVKTVFIQRTLHRQTTHLWKIGFSICGSANHKPFWIYDVCWFGSSHTSEDVTSKMRTVLFRVTTQQAVVIPYWHGTTYWSLLKAQEIVVVVVVVVVVVIIIIIIIIINMIQCVHYTSTYARKQGYKWTKNTGINMCQNQ